MTTTPPDFVPSRDAGLLRDVAAIVLIVLGAVALAVAAFVQDRELGIAVVAAYSIAAGVVLGMNR